MVEVCGVVVTGMPGTGKSSLSKMISVCYGIERFPVGDTMRAINPMLDFARENVLIPDGVHLELDRRMIERMRDLTPQKRMIFDACLALYFVDLYHFPGIIKILIVADWEKCVERIALREDKTYDLAEQTTMQRIVDNNSRWGRLYPGSRGYFDPKKADIVIDNTRLDLEATKEVVVKGMKRLGLDLD